MSIKTLSINKVRQSPYKKNLKNAKDAVKKEECTVTSARMTVSDYWLLQDVLHARRMTFVRWMSEMINNEGKKYCKEK